MIIAPARQSTLPPPDKPLVENPVKVTMDIPLFYATERGPVAWDHTVFCSEAFAKTVLQTVTDLLLPQGLGLVHIGFYNPRMARKKGGTLIEPIRWSNHAYGEAMDFKGVMTEGGEFLSLDYVGKGAPVMDKELFKEIWQGCAEAIRAIDRTPEIVSEGAWVHIGIWPKT